MPGITVHENALLTATRLDDDARQAVGALYDSAGRLVPASVRSVDRTDLWLPADPERLIRSSPVVGRYKHQGSEFYVDEAILAGRVFAGWGHVITESISAAWAADQLPDAPIVIVPWGRIWVSAMPRIVETLRLAGWGDRRLILTSGECLFGRVHVPEHLVRLDELMHQDGRIDDAMNLVYDRMIVRSRTASPPAGPVFLARSTGHRRAHPAEEELTIALEANGVQILRGWEMSVQEQIAAVNAATALIAFSGSNLHNSVFAQRGTPVVEVQDDRAQRARRAGRIGLQEPLCQLRRQPFTTVDGFDNGKARPVRDLLVDVKTVLAWA